MRAKTKRAKIAKNRIKSERCRYISKEIVAMGLEEEYPGIPKAEYLCVK